MKLLSLLLLVAGLGLAQDKPMKIYDQPSEGKPTMQMREPTKEGTTRLTAWDGATVASSQVLFTSKPVAEIKAALTPANTLYLGGSSDQAPFRIYLDASPDSFLILNRDGKPLVRCVMATQKCTLIESKENQ